MEIKEIQIVTVRLDDDCSYLMEVLTPQYLLSLMTEKNQPFMEPRENYLVVERLTPEIMKETITAFVEENHAYWLKLLPISSYFEIETLNKVRDQIISKYYLEDSED